MPKKWWEVYSGDDEKKFFVGKNGQSGLIRDPKFEWRSTDRLSIESGLKKEIVEQIIDKYHKAGIVIQHPKDPEKWGYWEKVSPNTEERKSVSDEDKEKRIEKAKKKS